MNYDKYQSNFKGIDFITDQGFQLSYEYIGIVYPHKDSEPKTLWIKLDELYKETRFTILKETLAVMIREEVINATYKSRGR